MQNPSLETERGFGVNFNLRAMRFRTAKQDVVNQIDGIRNADRASAIGVTITNWCRRRATGEDITDQTDRIRDCYHSITVTVAAQTISSQVGSPGVEIEIKEHRIMAG